MNVVGPQYSSIIQQPRLSDARTRFFLCQINVDAARRERLVELVQSCGELVETGWELLAAILPRGAPADKLDDIGIASELRHTALSRIDMMRG